MHSVNAVAMAVSYPLTRRFLTSLAVVTATLGAVTTASADELRLLMFERDGCSYCKLWNEQIAPAYPKTAEGRAAPLTRLQIHDPIPDDITLTGRKPVFTPTFVLTDEGTEVARIEGYAGDEFFWGLLDQMLQKTGWRASDTNDSQTDPNDS